MDVYNIVSKPSYKKAVQVTDTNIDEVARWCGGLARQEEQAPNEPVRYLVVPTAHGEVPCQIGNWVVKGDVDFYPVLDSEFSKLYDFVDQEG